MSRDLSSPIAYVIGEALIDAVTHPGAPAVEHPGGSPANVALTLGRLGRRAQLLTHLGRDHRGDTVAAWLEQSQVSVDDASRGALRTSVAHALLDDTGRQVTSLISRGTCLMGMWSLVTLWWCTRGRLRQLCSLVGRRFMRCWPVRVIMPR